MQFWKTTAALALLSVFGSSAMAQNNAPAQAATQTAPEQCFARTDIQGLREVKRGVLLVQVRTGELWEMSLGPCPKYDFAGSGLTGPDAPVIESSGAQICVGKRASLRVPIGRTVSSSALYQTCRVSKIRKLSAEEAAALAK